MITKPYKYLLLTILLFTSACAAHTTVRQHAGYSPNTLKQKEIVILPTQAEVSSVKLMGQRERMYEYESHIEHLFNNKLASYLRSNGYKVSILSPQTAYELKLSSKVASLRENYNTQLNMLYKNQTLPKEEAIAITNSIGQGLHHNNDKALLLGNYHFSTKDSSARVASILIDALAGSKLTEDGELSIFAAGFVDDSTGNVLWTNKCGQKIDVYYSAFKNASSKSEELDNEMIDTMMKCVFNPLLKKEE
jgi:hypothetical protein